MLLDNLVNPEWITIDCDEPVTSDTIYHFPRQIKQHINWKTETMQLYNSSYVYNNDTCFIFLWEHFVSNVSINNIKLIRKEVHHINIVQYLFNAVIIRFLPIILTDMRYTMGYIKHGNFFSYNIMEANKSPETLYIFTQVHLDPKMEEISSNAKDI